MVFSLQAEEVAIENRAENLFFCESENDTKIIKVYR